MNAGKRGLSRLDTVALIWAGVTYFLFKLGGRLSRAVDENLADFGGDD